MDEKELVKESQRGNDEAFEELFNLYREKIKHTALRIVKDEELAADVTQETFVKAHQKITGFRLESKFYTWIYRIAYNFALQKLRQREKEKTVIFNENIVSLKPLKNEEIEEEALLAALATLSHKHRTVFEMYHLQNMPQKEIAALLNVPQGTVRSRLHTARLRIRRYLLEKHSR